MATAQQEIVKCQICGTTKNDVELIPANTLREVIVEEIRKSHPDWSKSGYICRHDLEMYRMEFVQNCLRQEKGELTNIEQEVLQSLKNQETISRNTNDDIESKLTFGQRIADKVADFGGSWVFIISFSSILVIWVAVNSIALLKKPFDPYPFILLNLVLSTTAAFQAPIIMMSQNRQESKDRMRAQHDYQVNLKAELEVRNLTDKIDHLLHQEWQRLMEIQQIQTDLMEELAGRLRELDNK